MLLTMKFIQHLQVGINELPIIVKLKEKAFSLLNQKWIITAVHKVATFLCPRFKILLFVSDFERNEVHMFIRDVI